MKSSSKNVCKISFFFLFVLFTSILCLTYGCGYHRAETTSKLPSWIKSIYIEPWSNRSNELLLSAWITQELRNEFMRRGPIVLAPEEEADVILTGQVEWVETEGLSYTRYDRSVERRVFVECSVKLRERKTGKVLWRTRNIRREEAFAVSSDVMHTEGMKDAALKKLSQDVAEIIYHRITSVF